MSVGSRPELTIFWLLGRAAIGDGSEAYLKRPGDEASSCGYDFPNFGPLTSSAVGAPTSCPIMFQGVTCQICSSASDAPLATRDGTSFRSKWRETGGARKAWHNFRLKRSYPIRQNLEVRRVSDQFDLELEASASDELILQVRRPTYLESRKIGIVHAFELNLSKCLLSAVSCSKLNVHLASLKQILFPGVPWYFQLSQESRD